MAGDHVIDHILDERAADLASGPRAEEGVPDWFATRLSTHQPSFGPRGMRGHGAPYAIHRSAWKGYSQKFAGWKGSLGSWLHPRSSSPIHRLWL